MTKKEWRQYQRERTARWKREHPERAKDLARRTRERFKVRMLEDPIFAARVRATRIERKRKYNKNNREKVRAALQRWRIANPEKVKLKLRKERLKRYGLTLESYENLERLQEKKCAICRGPQNVGLNLDVDHCHVTGRVRGLLCRRCNSIIGLAEDQDRLLEAAIRYLMVT